MEDTRFEIFTSDEGSLWVKEAHKLIYKEKKVYKSVQEVKMIALTEEAAEALYKYLKGRFEGGEAND